MRTRERIPGGNPLPLSQHDETGAEPMPQRVKRLLMVLAACAALAACSDKAQWRTDNIDGLMPTLDFNMMDDTGRPVNAQTYRGKTVLLYFGYTSCPDVCPTTLAQFKQTRARLGAQADRVRFVFVTVDPQRDTPDKMSKYLNVFDPAIVGLGGTEAELAPVWTAYGVYRQIQPGSSADAYTVDHSARVYLIDAQGNLRATYAFGVQADDIAQDVRYLLKQK